MEWLVSNQPAEGKPVSILDINPLQHLTTDAAISQHNYESIMNGLVQWDQSKLDSITVRLATRTDPYFVDYVLHTKYYYDKVYGAVSSETLLEPRCFAYSNKYNFTVSKDDLVKLRVNSIDNGGTSWQLYQILTVADEYDTVQVYETVDGNSVPVANTVQVVPHVKFQRSYEEGQYFRLYDTTSHEFRVYRANSYIEEEDTDIADVGEYASLVYEIGDSLYPTSDDPSGEIYVNSSTSISTAYIHMPKRPIDPTEKMSSRSSGYTQYCKIYVSGSYDGTKIRRGTLVYCCGDFFVSLKDAPTAGPVVIDPATNYATFGADEWSRTFPVPFTNAVITGSGTIRTVADTDIDGYVLRNVGDSDSSEKTQITLTGSFSVSGTPTQQSTGMNILQTSNYVNWPNAAVKWNAGETYTTNPNLSAYSKQDYSAVMVFDHTDPDNFKYKNIVNYDGPDLDQGLCIMLPVSVIDGNNVSHNPDDGTMIEFLFNIWPNHQYDGRSANDLIINKSQIYVYSVPDLDDYNANGFTVSTVEPIAKFSMARLVNFYMFSENVGVPDRPVCYKARFIYSAREKRWKTYDYYQLPDHIFLSPNGFVDPSQPEAYGVQTAGFPLYQNPFSDYNLSAIHVGEGYKNQIQKPGE